MHNIRPRNLSSSGESLYRLLGIEKKSSPEEVKKAYKKAALKHHPDKNLDDPLAGEKFKEINHANAVLSNPEKKDVYDEYGSLGLWVGERFGYEHVKTYFMFNNPCFKVLLICCGIFTGAYCCLCCCCCCCCCGKLKTNQENEDDLDYSQFNEEDPKDENVVTIQPSAMAMPPAAASATDSTKPSGEKYTFYETESKTPE